MKKPTILETLMVAPDDPILLRPPTTLSLDASVEALQLISDFPDVPELQAFGRAAVSFRLTAEELQEIRRLFQQAARKN